MAKQKKMQETGQVLPKIPLRMLTSLHKVKSDADIYEGLKELMNLLIMNDKEKIIALASSVETIDQAVKINSKQQYFSGRINILILLFELIKFAEFEIEAREKANKNA